MSIADRTHKTHTAQMTLFDEDLRRRVESLEHANASLQADLERQAHLWAEHVALRERLEAAKTEFRRLRRERDSLHTQVACLRAVVACYEAQQPVSPHLASAPSADDLLRLIALSHPDKWEGQPATALAHEVTVALNGLRARLEAGA